MGQFVHLVNLDIASNDTSKKALEGVRHINGLALTEAALTDKILR